MDYKNYERLKEGRTMEYRVDYGSEDAIYHRE